MDLLRSAAIESLNDTDCQQLPIVSGDLQTLESVHHWQMTGCSQ